MSWSELGRFYGQGDQAKWSEEVFHKKDKQPQKFHIAIWYDHDLQDQMKLNFYGNEKYEPL